jgi:hypothetical protein
MEQRCPEGLARIAFDDDYETHHAVPSRSHRLPELFLSKLSKGFIGTASSKCSELSIEMQSVSSFMIFV